MKKYKVKLTRDQLCFLFLLIDKKEHKKFKSLRKAYLNCIKQLTKGVSCEL